MEDYYNRTQPTSHIPENERGMTTKDWLKTWGLLCIPIANFIFLFMWAFGNDGNLNRKHFAKAYLIIMAIILVLQVILYVIFFVFMFAIGASMGSL